MRNLRRLIWLFVFVTIIIVSINACAGLRDDNVTSSASTEVPVILVNKPGIVNADTVPVRRGPGVEHEQAVTIFRDYSITVVGKSEDGKWYKVEIPGYFGDQSSLWVAVDFVILIFLTETVNLTLTVNLSFLPITDTLVPAQTPSSTTTGTPPIFPSNTRFAIQTSTNTLTATMTLPPIHTVTNTPTRTPQPIHTITPSATTTLQPIHTVTNTATASITPFPIHTVPDTPTSQTQGAPTPMGTRTP